MTEQQIAITAPGNVIVSAGAGCGKTTTMVERIIHKLKNGAALTDMLIVTFTRASAADIRVKLAERLNVLKREDGGKYFHIADEAIAAMPECDIGTLHSFCQRLIKTYFFAAGIDPSATVIDESEAKRTKLGCAARAVENALTSVDKFAEVYDMLRTRRDDMPVAEAVAETMDFALSLEDPIGYLRNDSFDCRLDEILERKKAALLSRAKALSDDATAAEFTELVKIIGETCDVLDGKTDGFSPIRFLPKSLEKRGESLSSIAKKRAVYDDFCAFKRDLAKFISLEKEADESKSRDCTPYSRAIRQTAENALELYAAKKKRLGRTDYSDLEHGARRVLCDDGCVKEIAERIKYVFIDEFQDVSPLQAAIADRLADSGAEMFLVGDVKQSIYGFRRCSPEFFRRKLESDGNYTKVALTKNYRSSKAVIDFVNNVFDGLMTSSFGGCDYAENKLDCMSKLEGEAEYFLVDDEPDDESDVERENGGCYSVMRAAEVKRFDREALFVAGKIGEYIEKNSKDGVDFDLSSIAVLVRSTKGRFVSDLTKILTESGVPCSVGKRSCVSDFPEAVALLDIARCVDDKCDDIALYTALRSPMGGFSDEELLQIAERGAKCARRKKIPTEKRGYEFWQKVAAYDGELKARLDGFFALRGEFARYAACHGAAETLGCITSRIGYFQHVYEYYDSAASAAAVDALIRVASERRCDLHTFLNYASDAQFDLGLSAGGNAVNITTIHSAKGLEYDYCIVADTARRFMMRELGEKVIINESCVATRVPETADGSLRLMPSAPWLAAHLDGDRIREEELRLFYVALTRAKKKLTVCGKNKKRSQNIYCQADFMTGGVKAEIEYKTAAELDPVAPPNADGVEKAVKDICAFDYKAAKKSRGEPIDLQIKTCVTAIIEQAGEDDYSSAAPVMTYDERWDGTSSAALRGSAYHKAMELIDFENPSFESIKDSVENSELVDGEAVERAARAMNELAKGAEFTARERYFMTDSGGTLVQGVIDLLICRKDGTAVIVDYKTSADSRLYGENYRTQLKLYAAAVEKASPYRVTKLYLYSFHKGLIAVE